MKQIMILFLAGMLMLTACTNDGSNSGSREPLVPGKGTTELRFEPMQCETYVWEEWYEENGVENSLLSEEEIIKLYYNNEHAVLDMSISNEQAYDVVCEACSICPRGNVLKVVVYDEQAWIFVEHGWDPALK